MSQELPDRIKATLTIELDFAKEDQPLIKGVLENIIENLSLSSSGHGSRTENSHYSYKMTSNVPSKPMTMERLFELFDASREEGEPSMAERISESMRPDYEKIEQWWESLSETQQGWFRDNYKGMTLVGQAWDVYQKYNDQEKAAFDLLK